MFKYFLSIYIFVIFHISLNEVLDAAKVLHGLRATAA